MLCDVLCEKKLGTIKLADNVIIAGACNPYRTKPKNFRYNENVGIKKASKYHSETNRLVHIVKPLPDKALEFVWDFGVLKTNETKEYIKSILCNAKVMHVNEFSQVISAAHEYFKINEDVSSVSLRDVKRFTELYSWFKKSLQIRQELTTQEENKAGLEIYPEFSSFKPGILSLFHCYFLRIASKDSRNSFLQIITEAFRTFDYTRNITEETIKAIIQAEQEDYLQRMNIPADIAKNGALRENIFALIPCVLNKIPIFICGKPGCSKSLAIQLIISNLRGDKSREPYFKTLQEIQIVSFQGSDSCTSEGIQKVFEKAKRFLKSDHLLPVVLFDEIGLAEISRHNPLKILHSLLENENRKVGFIGISN